MFGKKGFGKIDQIGDWPIGGICPPAGKLKTVTALLALFCLGFATLFNVDCRSG
jgi:hypothetical protein